MSFRRRLHVLLQELAGPRIVAVRFRPAAAGRWAAEVTYDDGPVEVLFRFDPGLASFSKQELIGLTKREALWLKDRKTDEAVGITAPA